MTVRQLCYHHACSTCVALLHFLSICIFLIKVEEWFEGYQLTHSLLSIQRRIYIATDEPGVIAEAKSR